MLSFLVLDFFQIVVFGVVLFKFPLKGKSDHYLSIILVGGAMAMLSKIVYHYIAPGQSLEMTMSSTLCFSAMSHLYLREVLSLNKIPSRVIVLNLIPFLISVLLFGYSVIDSVWPESLPISEGGGSFLAQTGRQIRTLVLAFYLLLDLYLMWKYRGELVRSQGTVSGSILVYFIVHKILLMSLILFSGRLGILQNMSIYIGLLSMPAALAVITYYKVLVGISRKAKTLETTLENYLRDKVAGTGQKYAKSSIDDEKYKEIAQQIESHMISEKSYLDMSFSAVQLAQALQVSQYDLSVAINQHLQSTFYEYINTYRIDYFLSHIGKVIDEETTILTLAYESGFNSKSTFNKYFKKIVGMSPTDYVRNHIGEDSGVSLPAR